MCRVRRLRASLYFECDRGQHHFDRLREHRVVINVNDVPCYTPVFKTCKFGAPRLGRMEKPEFGKAVVARWYVGTAVIWGEQPLSNKRFLSLVWQMLSFGFNRCLRHFEFSTWKYLLGMNLFSWLKSITGWKEPPFFSSRKIRFAAKYCTSSPKSKLPGSRKLLSANYILSRLMAPKTSCIATCSCNIVIGWVRQT